VASLTFDVYLRAPLDEVWEALTDRAVVPRWRFGMSFDTDWQPGSPLVSHDPNGAGTVLDAIPGHRLVYDWSDADHPAANNSQSSTVSFELTHLGEVTHLRLVHDGLAPDSPFLRTAAESWPLLLSGLKTLIETGEELPVPQHTS
jgi:uncharacterized protein YndB with AHSA1/START domain